MADGKTDYIYGMFNPYAGQFFYVGCSRKPEQRFATHVSAAKKAFKKGLKYVYPVQAYIVEMMRREQMPMMIIIESHRATRYRENVHLAETFWMHHLKQAGHPIVNKLGINWLAKNPNFYSEELSRRNLAVGAQS